MIKKVLIGIVVIVVAVAAGRFTAPSKTVTVEKIVTVEKVVQKKVYVKDTTKKNNKVTIKLVTIKPDGTKTIETKIVDQGELVVTQTGGTTTVSDKTSQSDKTQITEYKKEDTILSAAMKFPGVYGVAVDKRLLGPIWVGGYGFIDQTFGLKLGIGF